jgi:hypothetical protein
MSKIYIDKKNKQLLHDVFILKCYNGIEIQLEKKYIKINNIVNELQLPLVICDIINYYVNDLINIIITEYKYIIGQPIHTLTLNIHMIINCIELTFSDELTIDHKTTFSCHISYVKLPNDILEIEKNENNEKNYIYGMHDNIALFNKFMNVYYHKNKYIDEGYWDWFPECTYNNNKFELIPFSTIYIINNKKIFKNIIVVMKIIIKNAKHILKNLN